MNNRYEITTNIHGKDYTGEKYGRLTVIGLDKERCFYSNGRSCKKWVCRCDCGNIVSLTTSEFVYGKTKSCGCLKREMDIMRINFIDRTTHGECSNGEKTRLFRIWCGIKNRCNNPNNNIYKYYGGRGIQVCDEWANDYLTFKSWALLNGYKDDENNPLTIDRIDVDKDYSPDNCRWTTRKEQANNKRNNTFLEYNNEVRTIAEWSSIIGINQATIWRRINVQGWSIEDALALPLYVRHSSKKLNGGE